VGVNDTYAPIIKYNLAVMCVCPLVQKGLYVHLGLLQSTLAFFVQPVLSCPSIMHTTNQDILANLGKTHHIAAATAVVDSFAPARLGHPLCFAYDVSRPEGVSTALRGSIFIHRATLLVVFVEHYARAIFIF